MSVVIYSDGGADPNPGIGGWSAIIIANGREEILTGSERYTTNNRMELQAAIEALRFLKRPSIVDFHTDSDYVRLGITEWIDKWRVDDWKRRGRPVRNADLWRVLWNEAQRHEIRWHWVRSHAGDPLNERVDRLAREARLSISPQATATPDAPSLYLRASCRGNPGPGGWGVVLEQDGETRQTSGYEPQTTNNRMELTAAVEGLRLLPAGSSVAVYTTSDYLYQGATRWLAGWRARGWKKRDGRPVSNQDLWQALDHFMNRLQVQWHNAKGGVEGERPGLQEAARLAAEAVNYER